MLFAVGVGAPLGIGSAIKQYSLLDYGSSFVAMLLFSLPAFWLGTMCQVLFCLTLHWLPTSGFTSAKSLILPTLILGANTMATMIRVSRTSMLDVIRQDYIRTAKAKGAPNRVVIRHHALRNGLIPVVTQIGVSFAIISIAFVIGALIGGISGFFGGKVDTILMRLVDMLMAVPSSLLAMAIITALGNGVWKLVVALAISQVARFARIVRSSVLTLRNVEFIEAAKCYGCSSLRIILKHILPNGIGPIIVSATLCLGQTILSISSMGYLGLGVASPTPEWGTIISENKINIQAYPYLGLIPGICICLTVMAVNFIGDGLRDAFDPRTKK